LRRATHSNSGLPSAVCRRNPSKIAIDIYVIYVAQHCGSCTYAYEVADGIRHPFPYVQVRMIDLANSREPIPEAVFGTPTYLLNGRRWSLGNPSPAKVQETMTRMSNSPA
jgi:hypothetical protein